MCLYVKLDHLQSSFASSVHLCFLPFHSSTSCTRHPGLLQATGIHPGHDLEPVRCRQGWKTFHWGVLHSVSSDQICQERYGKKSHSPESLGRQSAEGHQWMVGDPAGRCNARWVLQNSCWITVTRKVRNSLSVLWIQTVACSRFLGQIVKAVPLMHCHTLHHC